ncbi:MAG TPA: cupin domain-containing protein [Blastocatellia bacterium]
MAVLTITTDKVTLTDPAEISSYLQGIGLEYERWEASRPVATDAPAEEILSAYAEEIDVLKARGGYVTADVIDVKSDTPGLDAMLDKFNREHWHDDDEVRFIVRGRGIFHINPKDSAVVAIEVGAGDLIRVPKGTLHWFNLCADRNIRAIRLFRDPSGWAPLYTESGVDKGHQPLCFGPAYVAPGLTSDSTGDAVR